MKPPYVRVALALGLVGLAFVLGRATASLPADGAGIATHNADPTTTGKNSSGVRQQPRPIAADKNSTAVLSEATLTPGLQDAPVSIASDAQLQALIQHLVAWARKDPRAALAYARDKFTLTRQDQIVTAILADWTTRDPHATWEWVGQQASGNAQCVDAVLSVLGKRDAALTRNFADDFSRRHPEAARPTYVSALRGIMYAGNYELATAMVAEADWSASPGGREALSRLVGSMWSQYEPRKAAEWAQSLPDGAVREQALLGIGEAWAAKDPAAAATFAVTALPPGEARRTAVTQAVTNWVQNDPAAVARWLGQQKAGTDLDEAITWLATHPDAIRGNTITALQWANQIGDRELRTQTLVRILSSLDRNRPDTTAAYLESPAVPSDLRDEVRRRIANGDIYQSAPSP